MLNRNAWNAWYRADRQSPWRWTASGAFYGEAHSKAMLRTNGTGEVIVLFGRQLPEEYERRYLRMSR